MKNQIRLGALLLILLALPGAAVLAQGGGEADNCPALVEEALNSVTDVCNDLDRNAACYGHNRVDALFWEPRDDLVFSAPADRVGLEELQTIATTPLDIDAAEWGVALLHLQANLPDTLPGQAVTMLVMGDTSVTNAVPPAGATAPVEPVPATVISAANLRSAPTTTANVLTSVPAGAGVTLTGLNEGRDWYQVELTTGGSAWVYATLVRPTDSALALNLPVITSGGAAAQYGPMQAFYFTTGLAAPTCNEAPNALIVQSPSRTEVALNVNALEIRLGSTALLTSATTANGSPVMVAMLLEGRLQTTAGGYPIVISQPGTAIALPVNDEGLVEPGAALIPVPAGALNTLYGAACTNAVNSGLLNPALNSAACTRPVNVYVPPPPVIATPVPTQPTAAPDQPTATPDPNQGPAPIINFMVDRPTISSGECVTLSWDVQNIQEVYYQGEGVTGQGSRQECPEGTTTYNLYVTLPNGGNESRSITVNVSAMPTDPVIDFYADRYTVMSGECVNISWLAQGVSAVYYQGQGVTGQETRSECPTSTESYFLTVVLPSGEELSQSLTIMVESPNIN